MWYEPIASFPDQMKKRSAARPNLPARRLADASAIKEERPVRMKDVARLAGVAVTTVSRALSTPEQVAPKTLQAIKQAIDELGYLPNGLAGTLRSNRSRMIAVLVPNISHSVFAETLQGMSDVFRPEGYQLLIGHTGYSMVQEEALVTTLLSRRPDGIVLTGYTHLPSTVKLLRMAGIPIIEMWNLTETPLDMMVGFSNFEAARSMTLHLVERGYRRIGYVGGLVEDNDRTVQREEGFIAGLREAGIPVNPDTMFRMPFEFEGGMQAFQNIMAKAPDTQAIFAAGDVLAIGVMLECARQGWRVPEQLAVAGFDDTRMAGLMVPALTTIRVPRYEIGQRAAELMLARLLHGTTEPRIVDVGFEVLPRDTVGHIHPA